MNVRQFALLCAALWPLAGCHTDPYVSAHIEMLNAARRSLEDQVYELEFEYEAKAKEAERLRAENERLRTGSAPSAPARAVPDGLQIQPPRVMIPEARPRAEPAVPPALEIDPQELRPPEVEPGVPVEPSDVAPSVPPPIPFRRPTSGPAVQPQRTPAPPLDAGDPRIIEVYINSELTRGGNWDGKPGDDGLVVVLEPRNSQGAYVPLAGPITVVALDPAEPGQQKRFARWDLDAADVDRQMRQSDSRQGIELTLPWPDKPPKHDQLQIHVRYTTVDGRQIESSHPVLVEAATRLTRAWSTRPAAPAADVPPAAAQDVARPEWRPFR